MNRSAFQNQFAAGRLRAWAAFVGVAAIAAAIGLMPDDSRRAWAEPAESPGDDAAPRDTASTDGSASPSAVQTRRRTKTKKKAPLVAPRANDADHASDSAENGESGDASAENPTGLAPRPRAETEAAPRPKAPAGDGLPRHAVGLAAAQFDGVRPGETSVQELLANWGRPEKEQTDGEFSRRTYAREPFSKIAVTSDGSLVLAVAIHLREMLEPAKVANSMDLAGQAPVPMRDESGRVIGQHFPERGVTLRFALRDAGAATPRVESDKEMADWPVAQIVIEPIDAESFLWRADARSDEDASAALQDLSLALETDPEFVGALYRRADLLLRHGLGRQALDEVEAGLQLEAEHVRLRILKAKILARHCDFTAARQTIDRVLSTKDIEPHDRAAALNVFAELLIVGPEADEEESAAWRGEAIELAERQAAHPNLAVRRAAKEVLVEAHLQMARDLAWGNWNSKATVTPQWLSRARLLADEAVAAGELPADWRRRVALQSLAAIAGLQGELDPAEYLTPALQEGRRKIDAAVDPLTARRLHWELGEALYDAAQCYVNRNDSQAALEYGGMAAFHLEKGQAGRQMAPAENYLLGRLYFRLGSLYAATPAGHAEAVRWYDKAAPLLTQPLPEASFADVASQGDSCLRMAVSYWAVKNRPQALQLMEQALDLMQQAVDEGLLDRSTLEAPYENLALMHGKLGHRAKAREYELLAKQHRVAAEPGEK